MPHCGTRGVKTERKLGLESNVKMSIAREELSSQPNVFFSWWKMMTAKTISKRLDLEVGMARTVQELDLETCVPRWCGRRGSFWSVRHKHIQIRFETCEAISRIGSQGLGKSRSLRVPQTCPWTQFPGNRLIPSWKAERRKLLSDTACEETPDDDRELSPENEAVGDHGTKVCLHSDFHIVCVCVCLDVRACAPA